MSPGLTHLSDDKSLMDRVTSLADSSERVLIGIIGAPGAGKSRLAARVAAAVGESAVVVPMDGFHLHDDELAHLGLSDRKGAPETFDVPGYVSLLRRIRSETDHTVYAPVFVRNREESVAGGIAVRPSHRVVITEGNYLLYDASDWSGVLPLLDETWFVQVDDELRRERLVRRHIEHGRSPGDAVTWATVSDQANADIVARTRMVANVVVDVG